MASNSLNLPTNYGGTPPETAFTGSYIRLKPHQVKGGGTTYECSRKTDACLDENLPEGSGVGVDTTIRAGLGIPSHSREK